MEIVYADPRIVVAVKPAGVLSTDEPGGMPQLLRQELGTPCIRTVHRLDAAVSGLMVYARSAKAASLLSEQIRSRTFGKEYLAVVHGVPEGGVMTDLLGRIPSGGVPMWRRSRGRMCVRRSCPMRCWGAGRGCHWCVSGCTPGGPIKFGCSLPPVGFHWWGTGNTAGERKGKASPCGRGGWSLPIHRPGRPCGFPNCRPERPRGWAFPCP